MPALTESALKEKIKNNPAGVYVIYGEEDYLKKVYTDKIVKRTVDGAFAEFNFHSFDGKETTLSEIYESAVSVPMMAETKCVLVKDFPLDTVDDSEQLETLIEDCPEDCALVFSFLTYEPKGAKWNKVLKLFEHSAYTVKLDKKSVSDLVKTVQNGAAKRGVPFAKGVADYFVSCVGSDFNTLLNELEKLCAYAQEEIKKSDVDAVCVKSLESKVFDMIKDLTAGRFDASFRKLGQLFEQREDEFQILGALIATYSDIYRAKAAVKSGGRAEMIAKYYNYAGKEFRLTNAARNGSSLSFEAIGECISILLEADTQMKSTSISKRLILEQTLVRLVGAARR